MRLRRIPSVLLAAVLFFLASCSLLPSSAVKVEGAWARPGGPAAASTGSGAMGSGAMASMGNTSAVYFTLTGSSGRADALVAARIDPGIAETVEIHETKIVDNVAKMQPVPRVDVPAGGRVEFKPGGLHLMLINLKRELKVGDRFAVTLVFEKGGELAVDAEVRVP